jgi:ArsR family transcriptional regulator
MSMSTDMDVATPPVAMLKALAEPMRWSIVTALAREELCVCHLTEDLGAPQPLISHHLRVLRDAGIVESEKWRYWTYYRLRADALSALVDLASSLAQDRESAADRRRPCC